MHPLKGGRWLVVMGQVSEDNRWLWSPAPMGGSAVAREQPLEFEGHAAG